MDLDLATYAALAAELAGAGAARAEILRRRGLDESSWDAIDTEWQSRLSAAWDETDDEMPELLVRFSAVYAAAQQSEAGPIAFESFAEVTRLLLASSDLRASLAKVGVSVSDYTRGSEHWTQRMAAAPDLARRFEELVRGRGTRWPG